MVDVVVAGAAGRMGSRLVALLQEQQDLHLVGALEAPGHPALGKDAGEVAGVSRLDVPITADPERVLGKNRILIEFSVPEATLAHLRLVARNGGRAVIGTTGFSAAQKDEVERLAKQAPIMLSPNMSVAVNVAFQVLADIARMLGDDYDVEITEIHHRFKKDAPSGTALQMAEVVAQALGRDLAKTGVYGRHGLTGERTQKEIGLQSLRSGDVVGEHTVSFGALGERLELTHRAHSRDTFGRGALRAARFIATAPPGLYSMQDVLGLTDR
ncbi:MAG TPA: 4-hydroxy-tetrahydrodipicolinate reductase [Methylomirabilota bacterium]|jgi:4-hydroxy-tetrahydrodipicolinate reductase|nr:4-hydroxy-tetrahydrodipicolinate reductase [Methylomirabilota bacterium]